MTATVVSWAAFLVFCILLIRINQIGDRYWKLQSDMSAVRKEIEYLRQQIEKRKP